MVTVVHTWGSYLTVNKSIGTQILGSVKIYFAVVASGMFQEMSAILFQTHDMSMQVRLQVTSVFTDDLFW